MLEGLFEDHPNVEKLVNALSRIGEDAGVPADDIVWRLLAAAFIGWLIGAAYRRTFTGRKFSSTLPDTHMLLCLGGAMIWLVVGDNLVRAFGLAGTIGLIRYRTIVRDPKDTTILLFSMVMGMACGLGQLVVAIIGTAFIICVLALLHLRHRRALAVQAKQSASLLDLFDTTEEEGRKKKKKPPKDDRDDD